MGYSVALFGEITFPEKAKTRWKKQPADARAFTDWPEGFAAETGEQGEDYEPPTAADLLKAHAPRKGLRGEGALRFVELDGDKNHVRLRALLDEPGSGALQRALAALFRSAADVGAEGEILVLGWDDCPFDLGFRGEIAPERSTFVALPRKEIARAGNHPIMDELRARIAAVVETMQAEGAAEEPAPLSLPHDLRHLWNRIVAHVRSLDPARIWDSPLYTDHLIMTKDSGFVPAGELFADGAEYQRAVLEGSPKVDEGEARALTASAVTVAAVVDPDVGIAWAERILRTPGAPPDLREAAADGVEGATEESVEALIFALAASAPDTAAHGAAVLLANRGPGRALGRASFAGTGARLVAELREIAGGRRARKMDERAQVLAEALIQVLARRREPDAVETLHHLRVRPAASLAAAARDALLRIGGEEALLPLAAELGVPGKDAVGAVAAVLQGSPEAAFDRLAPFFDDARRRADPVAAEIVRVVLWKLEHELAETREGSPRADPRWVDLLVRVAQTEPGTSDPLDAIAQWRDAAVPLLGLTGDDRAVPVLFSLFGKVEAQTLCDALEPMLDRSAVPRLREIGKGLKRRDERAAVEELMAALS